MVSRWNSDPKSALTLCKRRLPTLPFSHGLPIMAPCLPPPPVSSMVFLPTVNKTSPLLFGLSVSFLATNHTVNLSFLVPSGVSMCGDYLVPEWGQSVTIRTLHVTHLPASPRQSNSLSILSPCRMAVASWLGARSLSSSGSEPHVQVSSGHSLYLCLFYL